MRRDAVGVGERGTLSGGQPWMGEVGELLFNPPGLRLSAFDVRVRTSRSWIPFLASPEFRGLRWTERCRGFGGVWRGYGGVQLTPVACQSPFKVPGRERGVPAIHARSHRPDCPRHPITWACRLTLSFTSTNRPGCVWLSVCA